MSAEKRNEQAPPEENPEKAGAGTNSRRAFLKKGGMTFVAVVGGASVVGAVLKRTKVNAAEKLPAAERDIQRAKFATEARAVLQTKGGAEAPFVLTEEGLVNLSDSSGGRARTTALRLAEPTAVSGSEAVPFQSGEAILIRMQRDLQRSLQKPVGLRSWAMVIDQRKCIGCSACTVACKAENKLPPGVVYRPVIEEEIGAYPHVSRRFTPRPCMHCDNPPCVSVCPVGATYKRPDGIVEVDYQVCIGCRYCIAACPYGARTFDWGLTYTTGTARQEAYELQPSPEYGQSWPRMAGASPINNVRKCQFCLHRLSVGMLPACTTTCVGGATYFGDAKDPDSLVAELMSLSNRTRLKEELGTKPRVYYLV